MKENYWRQNELENEEFQRQKEDQEHHFKLKEEKQREQQQQHTFEVNVNEEDTKATALEDRQKRRKIWQRLAKRKQEKKDNNKSNNDIENEINKTNQDSDRGRNLPNATNLTTSTTTDHLGQNNNNNIDDDNNDDDVDNHEERNENNVSLNANDDISLDDDNITKKREEEILQILSEQQERLFSAKALAAAATANANATTTTAKTIVEEKQQVKRQLQQQQQQQQQQPIKSNENELNLSFCGCGFLGIYHVGVASCFSEYAPQLSKQKISGSSAGALVAVAHICGNLQLAYATTDILRVAIDARARALGPFHPSFDISGIVREALEKGLPDDVHIRANGKLHVSLTRVYDGENVIVSEFGSKEDVIQVLLCSCFIPFWSGLVAPKYKGVTYIDGGFSNNLLTLDDRTVTVSPFSGEADICPQDDTFNLLQVSLSNTSFSLTPNNLYRLSHALLPPPPEILSDLCEQGFADGIRFLQRMKLISCTKCLEIRSSLLVTTNGEDMEEAFTNELEEAAIDGATYGDGLSATSDLQDDVSGWKRFSSNCGGINQQTDGKSSTASVGAASLDSSSEMSAAYLGQQQQSHHPHIILEQQEQKTIEINTATGRRRDSIRSTTSQVFIQQQHHTDSSLASSSSSSSSSGTRQRFPSSWQLNVNNNNDDNNIINNNNDTNATLTSIMFEDNASLASCNECVQMRQRALNQAMPKQFSDRIRDACDTVNKSLSNWIYSHRPIKYLSYLAAPYFLPLDISLALVYKCWRKLPFIRSEFINCIQEVVSFLIGIMKRMLARTTSTLLVESSLNWESRAIDYEKELINRTSSHSIGSAANGTTIAQASMQANVDIPTLVTDNSKDNSSPSPLSTTTTNRSNNCCSTTTSTTTTTSESHFSLRITTDGLCLSKQSRHSTSTSQLHSLEDTFDSIVEVSSNQEARIFAYYFRDAKNRLQVTEIFDYERAATNNTDNSANGTTTNTIDQPTNNSNNIKQLQQSQQQQPPMIGAPPTNTNNNNTNHINNNNTKHKV